MIMSEHWFVAANITSKAYLVVGTVAEGIKGEALIVGTSAAKIEQAQVLQALFQGLQ